MTQELIINGINWLDPRMLGLKCWFSGNLNQMKLICPNELTHVGFNAAKEPLFYDESGDTWFECRLAQGDKTPCDGKGEQPVPDGVMVVVWWNMFEQGTRTYRSGPVLAQTVPWGEVAYFRVQEQKLEETIGNEVSALYEVIASFEGISMRQSTACDLASHILSSGYSQAAVPTELLQRIDDALGNAKTVAAIEGLYTDIKEIDSLRKQLSEVV